MSIPCHINRLIYKCVIKFNCDTEKKMYVYIERESIDTQAHIVIISMFEENLNSAIFLGCISYIYIYIYIYRERERERERERDFYSIYWNKWYMYIPCSSYNYHR